jgi:hypothetical protein
MLFFKVEIMRNTNCRYMINAIGKGGETYFTHCQSKKDVKNWLNDNKDKINANEVRIVDKHRIPLLDKLFLRG